MLTQVRIFIWPLFRQFYFLRVAFPFIIITVSTLLCIIAFWVAFFTRVQIDCSINLKIISKEIVFKNNVFYFTFLDYFNSNISIYKDMHHTVVLNYSRNITLDKIQFTYTIKFNNFCTKVICTTLQQFLAIIKKNQSQRESLSVKLWGWGMMFPAAWAYSQVESQGSRAGLSNTVYHSMVTCGYQTAAKWTVWIAVCF